MRIVLAGLLVVVLVAAGPATAPSTAPAAIGSVRELLDLIPADKQPARGQVWSQLQAELALEWLRGNVVGRAVQVDGPLAAVSLHDGRPATTLLGGAVRGKTIAASSSQAVVEFRADVADELAKIREGTKVRVIGTIAGVNFNSDRDGATVRVRLQLDNGSLTTSRGR